MQQPDTNSGASDTDKAEKQKDEQSVSTEFKFGGVSDVEVLHEVEHFSNGNFSDEDIETIAAHLNDRTFELAKAILDEAVKYHHGDACLSQAYYDHMRQVSKGPVEGQTEEEWEALVKFYAFLIKDWSIYPEVRAVTRPIEDEPDEEYETIRAYVVSVLWSCAGSVLATFFAIRYPSISMNGVALQLIIAYTGRLIRFIPDWSIPLGFGKRIRWGGGAWSFKEQMLATAGMGVGNQAPYSLNVIVAMSNEHFYGFKEANDFGFIILLTLATNAMGFGLAGMFRVFLIYPTRMLWYSVLPSLSMSRALVLGEKERENINGWKLKGWEFFWIFSLAEFCWYWVTDFLFIFLGEFDWMAWISPHNNNLLSVCGVTEGLAVNPFPSLDWSIFGPGAMVTPYFSTMGYLGGMAISACAICVMFWTNVRYTAYIPINTNELYDNQGNVFDVSRVLDENHNLDEEKYQNYSPPFWSAGNISNYGAYFMFYPGMIVFAFLNYFEILTYSSKVFYRTIANPKKALHAFDDRFSRVQQRYKEAPEWWYLLLLCICIGMGIACVEHYSFTKTPVWTIFFGIGLSAVFMVPCGVMYATANNQIQIDVLFELVVGLTVKGNGAALMVAKAFAANFMAETDSFMGNLKIAHYSGIAPRPMFRIQIVNVIANSFAQAGLMVWQTAPHSIPGVCDLSNKDKFTCQNQRTYFNAAVQWGTIGPARIFKKGGLYESMKWTFLIGALFPIPFWLIRRFVVFTARRRGWGARKEGASRLRNSSTVRYLLGFEWINNINELILIQGCFSWAPQNFMYQLPWLYVGFVFQVLLPRYYPRWWRKYNYLLYAAISVGYSYSALIMFFATSYRHMAQISWWGNDTGISLYPVARLNATEAEGGYFGPRRGEFP